MEDSVDTGEQQALYLNIGLSNGVMLRTMVDPISGTLTDTRTRYLGSKPVKLFRIKIQGKDSVLALSSRPWYIHVLLVYLD
jgi:splicing factor 3B subunit 3